MSADIFKMRPGVNCPLCAVTESSKSGSKIGSMAAIINRLYYTRTMHYV